MATQSSADLIPELKSLPKWPAIAVATRHVLRLAPLMLRSWQQQQIPAFDLCTTYAALAAVRGNLLDTRIAYVLNKYASSQVHENGLMIAAAELTRLPILDHPDLGFDRILFRHFNLSPSYSYELRNDYDIATKLQSKSGSDVAVPPGFFTEVLRTDFDEVKPWLDALTKSGMSDFARRFEQQLSGQGIDFDEAERRIQEWAAENVKQPPPKKVRRQTAQQKQPEKRAETADSRMLSDDPVDEAGDRLDFKPYANSIARLINNPKTKTPLTLAINAPWGAGKSTLARMIESRLNKLPAFERTKPHVICWFNAWMHDDAPNLAAAFAAEITRTANRRRPAWRRLIQPLPSELLSSEDRLRRGTWISLTLLLGFVPVLYALVQNLRVTGVNGSILDPAIAAVISQNSLPGLILIALAGLTKVWTALSPVLGFVSDPRKAAARGSMNKVREQLGILIKQATSGGNRFIIFVDDIERCQAPRSIDVLEVVNQLLGHEHVITVLMADIPAVAASAQIKYEKLAAVYTPTGFGSAPGGVSYGRAYLQKIIQLQFDMPAHDPVKIQRMVEAFAKAEAEEKEETNSKSELEISDFLLSVKARFKERISPITHHWIQGFQIRRSLRNAWRNAPAGAGMLFVLIALAGALPHWCISKADLWAYPRPAGWPSFWPKRRWLVFSCVLDALCVVLFLAALSPWFLLAYLGPTFTPVRALIVIDSIFAVIVLTSAVAYARSRDQQIQDSKILVETDRLVAGRREHTEQNLSEMLRQVEEQTGIKVSEEIILEQMQLMVADESQMRRDAEAEIIAFLPALPRNAKRVINRLRLFLLIGSERKMFQGEDAISSRQMAKWAVLCEKWPDLAYAVARRPKLMDEIEQEARKRKTAFAALLQKAAPSCAADEELLRFCKGGVRIGGITERLLQFESSIPDKG